MYAALFNECKISVCLSVVSVQIHRDNLPSMLQYAVQTRMQWLLIAANLVQYMQVAPFFTTPDYKTCI